MILDYWDVLSSWGAVCFVWISTECPTVNISGVYLAIRTIEVHIHLSCDCRGIFHKKDYRSI